MHRCPCEVCGAIYENDSRIGGGRHAIVRAGLRALLEAAEDMLVVGEAENGQEAVRETERLRPNVVLLDLAMPRLNGVSAARQIV